MNWIDFKKEKPKEEPERLILISFRSNLYQVVYTKRLTSTEITHWAEIEPPPKPDPFEEFWVKADLLITRMPKDVVREIWDATIKHMAEQWGLKVS